MASELKPCPFCAKPLTVRNGVNPYGRCDTEGCWMAEAKIGISCDDPKQVERWNTRPTPATGIEDLLKKAVAAFKALSPEQQAEMMEEQRQSWVRGNVGLSRDERGMTSPVMPRPAPAATDTGLKTIGFVPPMFAEGKGANYNDIFRSVSIAENYTAVVTRSQADELLAAKDAIIERHREAQVILGKQLDEVIADNAAKDARIKELEDYSREATKAITGLTGGGSENFGKEIGDVFTADLPYCLERIRERYVSKVELKRLEAKLAAAEKIAQEVLSLIAGDAGIPDRIRGKARAVPGGKP